MSCSKNDCLQVRYWKIRGLVEPIKTLAAYLKLHVDFQNITEMAEWQKEKEGLISSGFLLANLPYIKDKDTYLSETMVILHYLAHKANRNDLFEQSFNFCELKGAISDMKMTLTLPCYQSTSIEDLKGKLEYSKQRMASKINATSSLIQKSGFLYGKLTVLDFYLVELIEMVLKMEEELSIDILGANRGVFKDYVKRMLALEGVAEYRKSTNFSERPFNAAMAIWK